VSLEFLSPAAAKRDGRFAPLARSPMERQARAAGARFELRDGWSVAVAYAPAEHEAETLRRAAGFADVSHLGKLELQAEPGDLEATVARATGGARPSLGQAARAAGGWWCPVTASRVMVVCEPQDLRALSELLVDSGRPINVVEVTTVFAALTIAGPLAPEVLARFCAIDLRPQVTPVGAVRPGSVARQPGVVVYEGENRFLVLFGWAVGEYIWGQVEEAARNLGGGPVGVDALGSLDRPASRSQRVAQEVRSGA
jgi:heterotetrameric sarcosine oxidase gamma subunit